MLKLGALICISKFQEKHPGNVNCCECVRLVTERSHSGKLITTTAAIFGPEFPSLLVCLQSSPCLPRISSFFPPISPISIPPLAASVSSFFPQRKFEPNQLLNTYLVWIIFCPFFCLACLCKSCSRYTRHESYLHKSYI